MYTIDLAYVGRGLHEELVAYITDQQGYYYDDEGVHVALRDGCSWDEERLRHGATIGLGRALLSRLADGIPWVALNVTHHPLFWFLARPGLTSLTDLAGRRLAVHAPTPHPGASSGSCCARRLDPDRDIHTIVRPPGDYGMDLRWLHDGRIDAAMIGSTMAPEAIAAEHGWQVLAWVGDHFQTFLGRRTADEARAHYETFIAPYFTTDGQADLAVGATAITAVAAELGVPADVTATEFYRTATTTL